MNEETLEQGSTMRREVIGVQCKDASISNAEAFRAAKAVFNAKVI